MTYTKASFGSLEGNGMKLNKFNEWNGMKLSNFVWMF